MQKLDTTAKESGKLRERIEEFFLNKAAMNKNINKSNCIKGGQNAGMEMGEVFMSTLSTVEFPANWHIFTRLMHGYQLACQTWYH